MTLVLVLSPALLGGFLLETDVFLESTSALALSAAALTLLVDELDTLTLADLLENLLDVSLDLLSARLATDPLGLGVFSAFESLMLFIEDLAGLFLFNTDLPESTFEVTFLVDIDRPDFSLFSTFFTSLALGSLGLTYFCGGDPRFTSSISVFVVGTDNNLPRKGRAVCNSESSWLFPCFRSANDLAANTSCRVTG